MALFSGRLVVRQVSQASHRGAAFLSVGTEDRPTRLAAKLKQALQTEQVRVFDDTPVGEGGHVEVEVTSHLFVGKTRLQQHRMVNEAVGDEMKTIHALHVRTQLPAQ